MTRLRLWWQKTNKTLLTVLALLVVVVAFSLAVYRFGWDWTGFNRDIGPQLKPNEQYRPEKTLWDWMQLLLVPVMLAIGGFWLNSKLQKTIEDQKFVQSQYASIVTYVQEQHVALITAYLRLFEGEGAIVTGEAFAKIALKADNDVMRPFRKYQPLLDKQTIDKIYYIHDILAQFQDNPSPDAIESFRSWKAEFYNEISDARDILQPELILYRKGIIGRAPYKPQGG